MFRRIALAAGLFLCGFARSAHTAEPPHVVMLSGSEEYKSDESLPQLQEYLRQQHKIESILLKATAVDNLPGTEALEKADLVVFFTRRLTISGEPLERVKRYCASGKPIVGIRTASHGFQNWLDFDKQYLGGNYTGHFGNGPKLTARINPESKDHPVLRGIPETWMSSYSLYKTAPLAADCVPLMSGQTSESGGPQPLTWVRELKGQRVFYTSLGGIEDIQMPAVRRLLANAILWTSGREVPAP